MSNHKEFDRIENNEIIQKLIKNGYQDLVDIFINEDKVYTKKGRLNKSGACRILGWKGKQLDEALKSCKDLLKEEFD